MADTEDRYGMETLPKSIATRDQLNTLTAPTNFLLGDGVAARKKCPKCAEKIRSAATRCKHCGYEYDLGELKAQRDAEAAMTRRGAIGCIVILIIGSLIFAIAQCSSTSRPSAAVGTTSTSTATHPLTHDDYVAQLKRETASLQKHDDRSAGSLDTKEGILAQVALFSVWAHLYDIGGDKSLTPPERELRAKFKRMLSAEQVSRFPALRQAQAKLLDAAMWENNVRVAAVGGGHDNLRLTGAMFANNANVAAGYEDLSDPLKALRFKRATFEWYRGSDSQSYKLTPPTDGQIATIGNDGWVVVP